MIFCSNFCCRKFNKLTFWSVKILNLLRLKFIDNKEFEKDLIMGEKNMSKKNNPLSRQENLVVQEIDGEVLIYDLKENKAFCLNETSALVWQSCDGKRTIAEISDIVGKQLNAKANEDIVWLALDQLSKENLIQNAEIPNGKFSGLSRREVIKKVGLASAIGLPLVATLVAPMAIHANSSCITGNFCTCAAGSGPNGSPCTVVLVPCADSNCVCLKTNNSGNSTSGSCIP